MWCEAKRVNCFYCSVFGECRKGSCSLPTVESPTPRTSSSYSVKAITEKSIDDIKREAVKEFAEELKAYYILFLGKEICSDLSEKDFSCLIDNIRKVYEKKNIIGPYGIPCEWCSKCDGNIGKE